MSVFKEIVGQSKAIATLKKSSQTMTHAWLFTGPPGSGRSNLARAFAASLICTNQGCGECTDCQTTQIGSHPDVEIFSTEGVTIKVDDIRELVSRAAWGASVAQWRITIIEDSDRMTESAANALLKAIEEPGSQSIWLLCAPTTDDVLPTIRSRCRLISLVTPTRDEVSSYLQLNFSTDKQTADLAATIAQGHVGRARHYVSQQEVLEVRKRVINVFLSIKNETSAINAASQILDIASSRAEMRNQELNKHEEEQLRLTIQGPHRGLLSGGAKALKELERTQKSRDTRAVRDELDSYLLWLQSVVRDALAPAIEEPSILINPDLIPEIQILRQATPPQNLEHLTQRINRYRASLDSNTAQLLALESFCLDYLHTTLGH